MAEGKKPAAPAWLGLIEAMVLVLGCGMLVIGLLVDPIRWQLLVIGAIAVATVLMTALPPAEARSDETPRWWIGLLVPFGFGVWASFAYLALRLRQPVLLLAASVYAAAIIAAVVLNLAAGDEGPASDVAAALMFGCWTAGCVHGYAIRRRVRERLATARPGSEIDRLTPEP